MTDSGQSLFEVVVAIAISALIIVALVSVTSNSIQNSSFSKNKSLAATYAEQASEWLRGQRDNNTDTFVAYATRGTFCLPDSPLTDNSWLLNRPCNSNDVIAGTLFRRWVSLSAGVQNGKDVVMADVTVEWQDSGGLHQIVDSTTLSQR
ncbi:MAG: hypothetical protein ABSE04_02375 [Candidatus Microgenomates bacterium]|jgi:Tfp pilus assembly protein PilV